MSTRCQIEFRHSTKYTNRKKPQIERRTLYRHSDGYPEGVIPDLKAFLKWNTGRNDDIEYQAANFIYWSKKGFEQYDKDNKAHNVLIGFGICENDGFHGDIEYFYEVVRERIQENEVSFKTTTKILVYTVERKDYDHPI